MVAKKKRNHPDIEELLARPWCYYCERDFDDLKILISHQKAKHFKCERCGRRLNTAGGLSVHMNQVHKETLTNVDNSLPNRQGLEVEIFGMEGIPDDIVQAHNQRIIAVYYQAEAERRAVTGNPGPGGSAGAGQPKKPKVESSAELKKRLAEHKARKAEQAAAGASSNNSSTPIGAERNSPMGRSPGAFNATPLAQPQGTSYNGAQGAAYGSFSQEPYSQPAVAYQQPFTQQPAFNGSPGTPYQPQYPQTQQYAGTQSFPPSFSPGQNFSTASQFTAGSPPPSNTANGYQQTSLQVPPQHSGLPSRPPSLPPAPGLPQRPSFGAPAVPSYQMQQLHQGQHQGGWVGNGWKGHEQKSAMTSTYPQGYIGDHLNNTVSANDLAPRETDDIDEIIRMAEAGIKPHKVIENVVNEHAPNTTEIMQPKTAESIDVSNIKSEHTEKKQKKEKPTRMIYSDNVLSPEERMAIMPRYAFNPEGNGESTVPEKAVVSIDATPTDS
ncbi:putative c2h2 finger domain-containing protein [Golovinomyces cichoracearum]|uniref:Putative c2h2 finger domain-containing protein n=1 Tax=Golovinomyces cichoracearum TaxID=62708 RepID=A0A420J386_9PEZI|nr:putative c2h2 finger domain-containing protein [Golovinomyces cichoracearum]